MVFDFDQIIERRGTSCAKWEKYTDRDVIPLWVADMDFASPPAVIDALHRRVEHMVFGYPVPPAELIAALHDRLAEDFGWNVDPEWLVWLPGLVSGLNVTCRAVGQAGDAVLTTVPVYPPFLSAPGLQDRELITAPLLLDGTTWTFDWARLEAAITPRTRLLILCSPYNPVGRIWTVDELTRVADICARHDIIICSDEIHNQLLLDQYKKHVPTSTLAPEVAARTITLLAPSKTYNIAGLGCSVAIISDPGLRRRFRATMSGTVPRVNLLGYTAAAAAYRDGQPWLNELLAYLRGNRDLVIQTISRIPGLSVTPIEATYLAWIDARRIGQSDPAAFFEDAGVGLSDGSDFGGPGFVRLNFGCPRSVLTTALQRMESAVAG